MELLKIHLNGQWELIQKQSRGGEFAGDKDADYRSYRVSSLEGRLPVDHGQRGKLHNVGNVRAPRQTSDHRMKGKVPNPMSSAASERNPGMGLN